MSTCQASNLRAFNSQMDMRKTEHENSRKMRQMLDDSLTERVAQIAADRQSGASEITAQVLQLLVTALERADPIHPLGRALVHAQPSMAPIWNAVRAALGAADPEG